MIQLGLEKKSILKAKYLHHCIIYKMQYLSNTNNTMNDAYVVLISSLCCIIKLMTFLDYLCFIFVLFTISVKFSFLPEVLFISVCYHNLLISFQVLLILIYFSLSFIIVIFTVVAKKSSSLISFNEKKYIYKQ